MGVLSWVLRDVGWDSEVMVGLRLRHVLAFRAGTRRRTGVREDSRTPNNGIDPAVPRKLARPPRWGSRHGRPRARPDLSPGHPPAERANANLALHGPVHPVRDASDRGATVRHTPRAHGSSRRRRQRVDPRRLLPDIERRVVPTLLQPGQRDLADPGRLHHDAGQLRSLTQGRSPRDWGIPRRPNPGYPLRIIRPWAPVTAMKSAIAW